MQRPETSDRARRRAEVENSKKWKSSSLGPIGIELAEKLWPVIEKWVLEHATPEVFPGDIAYVAKETVEAICEEQGLYFTHNRWRSAEMARRRGEARKP